MLLTSSLISFSSLSLPLLLFVKVLPFLDDLAHIVVQLLLNIQRKGIKLKAESIILLGIVTFKDLKEIFVLLSIKFIDSFNHLGLCKHILLIYLALGITILLGWPSRSFRCIRAFNLSTLRSWIFIWFLGFLIDIIGISFYFARCPSTISLPLNLCNLFFIILDFFIFLCHELLESFLSLSKWSLVGWITGLTMLLGWSKDVLSFKRLLHLLIELLSILYLVREYTVEILASSTHFKYS